MITRYDIVYMKMASEWGQLSNARRKKVGALLVKNNTIIADGYNGTPSGFENECETPIFDKDNNFYPIKNTTNVHSATQNKNLS